MNKPNEHFYLGAESVDPAAYANAGSKPLHRPEPLCRVDALAYLLFERPDQEKQSAFLQDFGMQLAGQDADAMYFRGHGLSPWFYACIKGDKARFLGAGYTLTSQADLQAMAVQYKVPVEQINAPGGGERVRLRDPDGFIVDLTFGREESARLPSRQPTADTNSPANKPRVNAGVRSHPEPSPLEKLGHLVMAVTSFERSAQWYMKNLGLIPTDVLCVKDGTPVLSFLRCDRGNTPADHHCVVVAQNIAPSLMHAAFETTDLDSIGQGAQYLRWKGRQHHWGIGRHILGSQLFDYWLDPWGVEMEHYSDGDVFTADHPTGYHPLTTGGLYTWGEDPPPSPKPGLLTVLKLLISGKASSMPPVVKRMAAALSSPARPWMK